jgi:iron(III) transport system ATP-binding protein
VPPEQRGIGLVFQSYALWPHLTVERNTDFGLRLRKVPKAEREARVTEVLRALGIEQVRQRYPSQLSGGQQQRVALARMLAVNPGVLLLDEPLSNLDARLRLEMRAELKRLHAAFNTTIVFVTHDQWEAMTLATTIAVMNQGVLQQMGTPDEIYDRPSTRFVAEFVGSPPINMVALEGEGQTDISGMVAQFLAKALPDPAAANAVGIRPEAIRLSEPGPVPADELAIAVRVTGILPTGGNWIVELRTERGVLFMSTHEPPGVAVGAEMRARVRREALHLFDRDGRRLEAASRILRGGPAEGGVAATPTMPAGSRMANA